MTRRAARTVFSLGVDVVEINRARSFYALHKKRLGSFFTKREIRFIETQARPHEGLAILLAAKEAAFKAARRVWMGPAGFKDIEVVRGKNTRLKISYTKTKKYVVAQCVGI